MGSVRCIAILKLKWLSVSAKSPSHSLTADRYHEVGQYPMIFPGHDPRLTLSAQLGGAYMYPGTIIALTSVIGLGFMIPIAFRDFSLSR